MDLDFWDCYGRENLIAELHDYTFRVLYGERKHFLYRNTCIHDNVNLHESHSEKMFVVSHAILIFPLSDSVLKNSYFSQGLFPFQLNLLIF